MFTAAEEAASRWEAGDHAANAPSTRMRIIMITRIALLACMAHATAYGSETLQKLTACLQVEAPDQHLISRTGTEVGYQNICRYRYCVGLEGM